MAQRPPSSALLRRAAIYADPQKTKEPPEPGMLCHSRWQQQPFDPLEPQARFARAQVEFGPRQALAPKIDSRHGALRST